MHLLRLRPLRLLLLVVTVGSACHAQAISPEAKTRFAETAVVSALGFQQGNLRSLADATPDCTEAAWPEFMKRLTGCGKSVTVNSGKSVTVHSFPGDSAFISGSG